MDEIDFTHDSEPTYRAIGHFIFEFSQLEAALKYYIGQECEIKDEHFAALIVYDFAMLCTIARKVLVADVDSDGKILDKIISDCRRMNDVRVRVTHGLWMPFMQGGTVTHISRRSLKPQLSPDQAKELENHARDIRLLRDNVERYAAGII